MRVFIRTSGWAIWSTRIARPVLPLALLAVLFHYIGIISADVFVATLLLATAFAVLAFCLGIVGYVSIWNSGDAGWRESSSGTIIGLFAICAVVAFVLFASQYPNINDVTTSRFASPIWSGAPVEETTLSQPIDLEVYRSATTRQYPIDEQTGEQMMAQAAAKMGWRKVGVVNSGAAEANHFYEARSWLGFVDDITVSRRTTERSVIVNLRSRSRYGSSDLGANSRRIEQYLVVLDELIAILPEPEVTN